MTKYVCAKCGNEIRRGLVVEWKHSKKWLNRNHFPISIDKRTYDYRLNKKVKFISELNYIVYDNKSCVLPDGYQTKYK